MCKREACLDEVVAVRTHRHVVCKEILSLLTCWHTIHMPHNNFKKKRNLTIIKCGKITLLRETRRKVQRNWLLNDNTRCYIT